MLPESLMYATRRLDKGRPLKIKTRAELLASINRNYWKFLREDAGDFPREPPRAAPAVRDALVQSHA